MMNRLPQSQTIKLPKDIRTFTRNSICNCLMNSDILWLKAGETIVVGAPRVMNYDHDGQVVVQVLHSTPERFIILRELEVNPWGIESPEDGSRRQKRR